MPSDQSQLRPRRDRRRRFADLGLGQPQRRHRRDLRTLLAALFVLLMVASCTSEGSAPVPTPTLPSDDEYQQGLDPNELEGENAAESSDEPDYEWAVQGAGAGGFVTGMSTDLRGETHIARTDVGGAYRWDDGSETWIQLLHADRVQDPIRGDYAVESAVVAPNDPQRIYLATGISDSDPQGRILRSDDGGLNWQVGAQDLIINGNGHYRTGAERLAVHPERPDEVWFASRAQGLLKSTDGAMTFTPVPGIDGGALIDDRPVGVTFVVISAVDNTVFVGVAADGVYASHDDGASWLLLYPTEGVPTDAEIDEDGRLWVAEDRPGALRVITALPGQNASIDDVTPPTGTLRTLALDPANPAGAIVGADGIARGVWRTRDSGQNWDVVSINTSCPTLPWLDDYANDFLPTGSLLIDPITHDLWVPEGFGVWRAADAMGNANRIDLVCEAAGIEEMVSTAAVIPRGGRPVTAHWDRGLYYHGSEDPSDAIHGPTARFNSAWDLDWSEANPEVVVAVVADHRFCCEGDGGAYASGWSDDGGQTWQRFGSYDRSHPEHLRFGNIAVAADTPDNIVWVPTFNQLPHVSHDRGETWQPIYLPGLEESFNEEGDYDGGSHFTYYLNRKILAADRIEPGTFYLYHQEQGLFRSVDGGTQWERQESTGLPVGWTVGFFNAHLISSPTDAGDLVFAPGELSEEVTGLYRSTDGGANWTRQPGVQDVTAMAFGAAADPDGPATLYIAGAVNGVSGVWRQQGIEQQWEFVTSAPGGNYQLIKAMAADVEEFGTIMVGFEGTSFMVGRDRSASGGDEG